MKLSCILSALHSVKQELKILYITPPLIPQAHSSNPRFTSTKGHTSQKGTKNNDSQSIYIYIYSLNFGNKRASVHAHSHLDRFIKVESPQGIIFLLQRTQSLQPPGLVPIDLLLRLVAEGVVDVGVELSAGLA